MSRNHRQYDDRREFSPNSYGDSEEDDYYDEESEDGNGHESSFYQPAGHLRRAVNVHHRRTGPTAKKAAVPTKGRTSHAQVHEKRTKSAKRELSANRGGEASKRRGSRQ